MVEIKKCPFCEGKANSKKDILGFYIVQCGLCGCKTRGTVTEEEAIRIWNRRGRNGGKDQNNG